MCMRACSVNAAPKMPTALAWMWHKRRLSDEPLCPEEAPALRLDKLGREALRWCAGPCPGFVPIGIMRAQPRCWGRRRCSVRKGLRQRGCVARCVWLSLLPFLGVPARAKCCPFFKYGENSAVGETVPSAAPGTRLRLRARCSGYSVGRRSPLEPATRKDSPGVESPPHCVQL